MENNISEMVNKVYSNNKNILLEIIDELQKIIDFFNDNILTKKLDGIIIKINNMITDNKKNLDIITNDITMIQNRDENAISNINDKQEVNYPDGSRYIGLIINGLKEGKGNFVWGKNGDKYEGEWNNDLMDGKGIYYFNNEPWKGDKYEGDFKNGKKEGKGVYYYKSGDRYEGDWKDNKKDGNGIYYYNNGDREVGDYLNEKRVGKHVLIKKSGEVKINNY